MEALLELIPADEAATRQTESYDFERENMDAQPHRFSLLVKLYAKRS